MKINGRLDLFFCEIHDYRTENGRPLFFNSNLILHYLEKLSEICLEPWLKNHSIWVMNEKLIYMGKRNINTTSLAFKIIRIAKTIFLFIPGILIKSIAWGCDLSYINQRNQYILESIQEKIKEKSKFELNTKVFNISSKQFTQPVLNQNSSQFLNIPKNMLTSVLSFSTNQDLFSLTQTCQKSHALVADYSSNIFNHCKYHLPLITKALTIKKFASLPFVTFDKNLWELFKLISEKDYFLQPRPFMDAAVNKPLLDKAEKTIQKLMKNNSVLKVQSPECQFIMIQIKDNLLNQTQIFMVTQHQFQYIWSWSLSNPLETFLNEMHSSDVPHIEDYLKRLFNNEPCGNFPENLNKMIIKNHTQDKISHLLEEGPRVCPDGITPVIQLWA